MSPWTRFSIYLQGDSEINSEWRKTNSLAEFVLASIYKEIPKWIRNDEKTIVVLNLFQHLFIRRFQNLLELLFHTTQSLILFALQILFAMLRATSSFGLRPHSTQNSQIRNDEKLNSRAELVSASIYKIIKNINKKKATFFDRVALLGIRKGIIGKFVGNLF